MFPLHDVRYRREQAKARTLPHVRSHHLQGQAFRDIEEQTKQIFIGTIQPRWDGRRMLKEEAGLKTRRTQRPAVWWSQTGSNRRPRACKARALPTELWPRRRAPCKTEGFARSDRDAELMRGTQAEGLH